ncbi:MAG: 2-iminoacetate synthase ThiH, partial [Myxococcota bacterium]
MLERLSNAVSPTISSILDNALSGAEISTADAAALLKTEGADLHALIAAADLARKEDIGENITYVVCRNINFTNVCYVGCSFCGFARHADEPDAYDRSDAELLAKCADAVARGATEVCIQGGIHPQKDHTHYHHILTTIKAVYPDLHIHAFSPEEIDHAHKK